MHEHDVARLRGVAFAAMPRVEISEAAAPASRAVEKVRLFIIMMSLPLIMRRDVSS